MSIQDATFVVQRGADQFSCLGKDLKDKLKNGDMMIVQRGADKKSWVVDDPPMPWDNHLGGIFHVKNASGTVDLTGGPFTAWDVDGTNERQITEIAAGEELVFITPRELEELFSNNTSQTWDFGDITDTSKITKMGLLFWNARVFNSDISGWDTSHVTDMNAMFWKAYAFNTDISSWDTSNVTDMSDMFAATSSFNQDISPWNTGKVKNMRSMFNNATAFNQDLSQWCVRIIRTAPADFALNATAWTKPQPVWGTCPRGEA